MATLTSWDLLRARVGTMHGLCQPRQPEPEPQQVPTCVVCRGPVRPGFTCCYQCARHDQAGHGLLADAVVPLSYAVRGTGFASDLWQYKSGQAPDAATSLLALLLLFLRDHADCVWRQAGMAAPDRLAVVPSGTGRPGPHPLLTMIRPYLRLPQAGLVLRPGTQSRQLSIGRFRASQAAGASVLLLDDSWVSGASIQSAAVALKLAGATHVAAVVLGRHIDPAGTLAASLANGRYEPATCTVHK
jgi:predicted amidophosphoribosyltransferase